MRYVLILIALAASVQATPPLDPICGTPDSFKLVEKIRRSMLARQSQRLGLLKAQQTDPSARLRIERESSLTHPYLILWGAPGKSYDLEATPAFGSGQWRSILSLSLGTEPLSWEDTAADPSRLYRLKRVEEEDFSDAASNFRLLDQQGTSYDLFYHAHLDAIVVLAAGTNIAEVGSIAPILDEVTKSYSNRVQTWILLSDPTPVRSNILAQAKTLKINYPVLSDVAGIAARSIGLTRAGEIAVIRPPTFSIPYRGLVSGPGHLTAASSYLAQAVAAAVADQSPTFRRTVGEGSLLNATARPTPTYSEDVAPVLYRYCATCHRTDGVAPFAMTDYSVVKGWSESMKNRLLSRRMPPWHADPEYGHFANDISMPEQDRATLVRWLDAGAPRGTGSDPLSELPPPPAYDVIPPSLGEPDETVTIPLQQIKAEGTEPYRYLFVQTKNPTNTWLRAAIIRHSNYKAVHHSLVWLGRQGNSGAPDNSTYYPYIAEFVPGYKPNFIPTNSYISLTKSNWLTFNLHYNTLNIATNDQPVLYLWYHKAKPPRVWKSDFIGDGTFTIPPYDRDYKVQSPAWTVPSSGITVLRLNPHMHLRGKRMKYEVVYANGNRETLLSVPDYDFNWQIGYQLAEPKTLPAGSKIVVSGAFDNSPENLANPDPSVSVRWGDQSWMEMFTGFIEYIQ
jgi:hypothetical protein